MSKRMAENAKSWVVKAVAFYKASGKRIALAEYSNPEGQFVQDEKYIYVLSLKGTMLAHGVNEKFVGEDFSDVKDYDGRSFIKTIIKKAKADGSGWVDYKWSNPVNKKIEQKSIYLEKYNNLVVVCGFYK